MVDQIERELVLPASADEVWEVITGPGWLAEDVELELIPGGDARFVSGEAVKAGWVEEAVAPGAGEGVAGRLAFWWAVDGDPATRVELTLEPEGQATTRLRVVEARPLELLDVIGMPVSRSGDASQGPALLAVA